MKPQLRSVPPGRETRINTRAHLRVERRDAGEGKTVAVIVGHGAVFDQWTTLYEGRYWIWREIVRPGAFTNALAENQDVRCLFNHDVNFVLGRTAAATLTLEEDATGLLYHAQSPDTQTIRDLVITPIERRDISGSSFAFSVRTAGKTITETQRPDGTYVIDRGGDRTTFRYEGDVLIEERELIDLNLYDVSPVAYPAYTGTDVGMRSLLDIEDRIREMDRPHRPGTPLRERAEADLEFALAGL